MKKFAFAAIVAAATLSLAACGSSDSASSPASSDNAEAPAEEPLSSIAAQPSPMVEPSTAAADPNAAPDPAAAAAAAAAAAQDFNAAGDGAPKSGADKALGEAEKKM